MLRRMEMECPSAQRTSASFPRVPLLESVARVRPSRARIWQSDRESARETGGLHVPRRGSSIPVCRFRSVVDLRSGGDGVPFGPHSARLRFGGGPRSNSPAPPAGTGDSRGFQGHRRVWPVPGTGGCRVAGVRHAGLLPKQCGSCRRRLVNWVGRIRIREASWRSGFDGRIRISASGPELGGLAIQDFSHFGDGEHEEGNSGCNGIREKASRQFAGSRPPAPFIGTCRPVL